MPSELIKYNGIVFEHVYKDVPAEPENGITAVKDTVALKVEDVNLLPLLENLWAIPQKGMPYLATDEILENGKRL
jgi:hypothetical protein